MTNVEIESDRSPAGVQAAEVVLRVLDSFVGAGPNLMLKEIAERAGLHPAKAI